MRAGSHGGPGTSDPGQVTYNNVTLKNLLMTAYGVKIYQISGPGWLDTERYDILAKLPPDATKEQFALMLQNLLAARFKMTLHHETKNLPLYELVVAKNGPKLKQSVDDPNAPPPGTMPAMGKDGVPKMPPSGAMMTGMNGSFRMGANKQSMSNLAEMLTNQVGSPVVDKTGLTGEYDYTLEFSPEGLPGGGMPAGLGFWALFHLEPEGRLRQVPPATRMPPVSLLPCSSSSPKSARTKNTICRWARKERATSFTPKACGLLLRHQLARGARDLPQAIRSLPGRANTPLRGGVVGHLCRYSMVTCRERRSAARTCRT
jgi:uncharacterized protein (TIGR03435 family)